MKKLLIILVIAIVVIWGGWYLISPAFNTIESDETSPIINDAMPTMDDATMVEFEGAVEEANQEEQTEISDSMPSAAQVIAEGSFKPRAHEVEGEALLIQDGDEKILRFENFETINGPNLHIYLSSELGDSDFVDLGKIEATKGNVNYEIPEDTDTDKYNKVLVWCVPFKVLFSYAELQ